MPAAAALLFSGGQSVTALIAGARIRDILRQALGTRGSVRPETRRLLGFAGAFLLTASIMPLVLFELRAVYRGSLGLEALGFWLAANRISDVNTQLMGLYMVQVFLPGMASIRKRTAAWRLVRHTFVVATLGMVAGLAFVLLAPTSLVSLFLSAKFVPAIPLVIGYLIGDTLRASASLGSYTALSQGRLAIYVGFEGAAAAMIAAILLLLLHGHVPNAPAIAYAGCYALMAPLAWLFIATQLRRVEPGAAEG
jgi:O-antigen/teichoic acid export membrane protein